MAKKKSKVTKVSKDNVKDYLKQISFEYDLCYVCEDGNVFWEESVARSHSLANDLPYFKATK